MAKSAVVERKTTRRFPVSIRFARVGHPLAGKDADGGAYANASISADLNAASYSVGERLSEFTMRREMTA